MHSSRHILLQKAAVQGRKKLKSILKTFFKTNLEINVSRPWLLGYLKYLTPKNYTTLQHMRQNENSLKMNIFFYLKAEG